MSEVAEKGKLAEVISLRCNYCGAPLDGSNEGKDIIKCKSCGTSQKMIDAKAFLDQILGNVYTWVSNAIPTGFDFAHAENVDPIARHNIFVNNVRPVLETEYGEYKFNSMNLFSNVLIVPPFRIDSSLESIDRAIDVFEFNAKIKSISQLAIDDESKNLINEVDVISIVYAYILNNLELISEDKTERFEFMSRNFSEAEEILEGNEKFLPLKKRISGLRNLSMASKHMLDGKFYNANFHAKEGIELLQNSQKNVMNNFDFAIMDQAIGKEISIGRTIIYIVNAAGLDPNKDPMNTISASENLIRILNKQENYGQGNWSSYLNNIERYEEIFNYFNLIRRAQNGEQTLRQVRGSGSVLFPFWEVNLPYSFQTGSLWMKKGIEVEEVVFVSAGFTAGERILCQPALGLTDIFRNRRYEGFFSTITGKETSISGGSPLKMIINAVSQENAGDKKVIVPLSTKREASYLVEGYIDQTMKTDRTIGTKLKLNSPRIKGLFFIPGDFYSDSYKLNVDLQGLYPQMIGDMEILSKVII